MPSADAILEPSLPFQDSMSASGFSSLSRLRNLQALLLEPRAFIRCGRCLIDFPHIYPPVDVEARLRTLHQGRVCLESVDGGMMPSNGNGGAAIGRCAPVLALAALSHALVAYSGAFSVQEPTHRQCPKTVKQEASHVTSMPITGCATTAATTATCVAHLLAILQAKGLQIAPTSIGLSRALVKQLLDLPLACGSDLRHS